MGIPLYFRYITKQYPEVVSHILTRLKKNGKKEEIHVDNLYLDMNCLIHPCSSKVLSKLKDTTISKEDLELKIVKAVKDYILYLCSFSKPQKLIYMAIDGPAPRAKMQQQRLRRFRSIQEKADISKIKKRLKQPEDTTTWDKNAITPGTPFLYNLGIQLEEWVQKEPAFKGLKILFSNANVPGEGEHKIFSYIRKSDTLKTESHVIYGLDADLIMLSMASQAPYIYLLREAVHFGKVHCEELLYMNIPLFTEYFTEEMFYDIVDPVFHNRNRLVCDYIVLCFFAGNDFLPHSLALHIGHKGIDRLVKAYAECINKKRFFMVDIETMTLDFDFAHELIASIAKEEDSIVAHFHNEYSRKRPYLKKGQTVLETEITKLNMSPFLNKHKYIHKIEAGTAHWRNRYYWHIFQIEPRSKLEVTEICHKFWEGVLWTFHYYFNKCISWEWYYPYPEAPTLQDLTEYDVRKLNPIRDNFVEGGPVNPLIQLMMVLPPQSSDLLPNAYARYMHSIDSPILEYYPTAISCIPYYKKWFHETIPELSSIDFDSLKMVLKDIKLTDEERERGSIFELNVYSC